jgi:hypothetical protein
MDPVDDVVRCYREHVQLTDEELDRLAGVLTIKPLHLMCHDYRDAVGAGRPPVALGWTAHVEKLAAHVRAAFRS